MAIFRAYGSRATIISQVYSNRFNRVIEAYINKRLYAPQGYAGIHTCVIALREKLIVTRAFVPGHLISRVCNIGNCHKKQIE